MSRTKGSKNATATTFAKVRHLQEHSDAHWTEIHRLTGVGQKTQAKIKQAITFERYKGIPALKRRTKRAVEQVAVKKQIIERNTKANAARIAVEHVVVTPADLSALRDEFEATKRQLATMIREDKKHRKTTISRMIDDELDKRFSEPTVSGGMVTNDPGFMIADYKPRKRWFGKVR